MRVDLRIEPTADSPLALEPRTLEPESTATVGDGEADTLAFVAGGAGTLELGDERRVLASRSAALVLAGEEATVSTNEDGLELVLMSVGPEVDRHAPMGPRQLGASLDTSPCCA